MKSYIRKNGDFRSFRLSLHETDRLYFATDPAKRAGCSSDFQFMRALVRKRLLGGPFCSLVSASPLIQVVDFKSDKRIVSAVSHKR
jgi:hypothetical protein